MTLEGPPPTRRALRSRTASQPTVAATTAAPVDGDPSALPLLVAAAALSGDDRATDAEPEAPAEPADPAEPGVTASDDVPVDTASRTTEVPTAEATAAPAAAPAAAPQPSVPVVLPARALPWVDESGVVARTSSRLQLEAHPSGYAPVSVDLLARAPRRSPWRPGVLVPFGLIVGLVAAYCATVLLWPLHAVAPTVSPVIVQPVAAAVAAPAWPAEGSAALVVDGVGAPVASALDAVPMASITKLVTALVVLDQAPLAPGEQGRSYQFTSADRSAYWAYRNRGESALDVPVGGTLTEYQLLQGTLIGSANNYADRLATTFWPNDAVFAAAANNWLTQRGITGVRVVDPSGIERGNTATPEGLLALAKRALANPVIAEIVRTPVVELPGAGTVTNTNPLLADPGVVGIKTGTLDRYNLLSAKDIAIADTTVRVYADVMDQPDGETRDAALRALFAQAEAELQLTPSVPAGTLAGQVDTLWSDPIAIVAGADASVVLWNGAVAETSSTFSLGDAREAGETVGTLTATGPKNAQTVDLVLDAEVPAPSVWWRLTHPLELFGLR